MDARAQAAGWDRYDSPEAVEAVNDLYRCELRLWLNLYLPSVKLVEKLRVGSKLRRVYDVPQTPLERVLASPPVDPARAAALKKLMQSLDPFELAKAIDQNLERIYELANRRLSPKAPPDHPSPKRTQPVQGKGWGKRLAPRAWKSLRDSHFPTTPATAVLRLHFKWRDDPPYGYILKWLDRLDVLVQMISDTRPSSVERRSWGLRCATFQFSGTTG